MQLKVKHEKNDTSFCDFGCFWGGEVKNRYLIWYSYSDHIRKKFWYSVWRRAGLKALSWCRSLGDRNINEVLELLSVDAGCACILLTPTKETVLCVACCVNIEISQLKETREQAGSFLALCSSASVVFFLFTLPVSPLPLPLSICINTFSLIAFSICLTGTHLYHSQSLCLLVHSSLTCPCFFFIIFLTCHLKLSWWTPHFLLCGFFLYSHVFLSSLLLLFLVKRKHKSNAIPKPKIRFLSQDFLGIGQQTEPSQSADLSRCLSLLLP